MLRESRHRSNAVPVLKERKFSVKKSCYTVIVSLMCVLLVACGKQEQAKETADGFVEKEVISQTAEPMETEESQKQSEEVGNLPEISLEEQTTAKPDKETPTDVPTEKPVVKPTEAPTSVPMTEPTEEPTSAPTESPTEAPTTEPTESPTEEPTTPPTEATTEEPIEEPTETPIELPFVPAF